MSLSGVPEVHEFPCGHYYTPENGFVRYYEVPPARVRFRRGAGAEKRNYFDLKNISPVIFSGVLYVA